MSEDSSRAFVEQVREIAQAAAPMTAEQALDALRRRMESVLARELKFAEVEWKEGRNLSFAVEDRYFQFAFDPNDPHFLALYAGAIARFDDEAGRIRALEAASAVTHDLKVAKVVVFRLDDAWLAGASVEVLLPGLDAIDKVFVKRLVGLLSRAMTEFRTRCARTASP